MSGIDNVLLIDMFLQIVAEERAGRNDLESAIPGRGKSGFDKGGPKPLAAVTCRNEGMIETNCPRRQVILGKSEFPVAEVDLETVSCSIVIDDWRRIHRHCLVTLR